MAQAVFFEDIVLWQYLFFVCLYIKRLIYGSNKDKDRVVLQDVWKRESEVDGQMPCVRGMEYDG